METIVLGGGCFWCIETIYKKVVGVVSLESGYTGGTIPNPTYLQVCGGTTGYVEVVKVTFDTTKIDLENILRIFFEVHDPTTLNQQGADIGTQYASRIFYTDVAQKEIIDRVIQEVQPNFKEPIVTAVAPLDDYYKAEEYHQDYYAKNPNQPYCIAVINPKLQKFLKTNLNGVKE